MVRIVMILVFAAGGYLFVTGAHEVLSTLLVTIFAWMVPP